MVTTKAKICNLSKLNVKIDLSERNPTMILYTFLRCVKIKVAEIVLLRWRMLDDGALIRLGKYAQ